MTKSCKCKIIKTLLQYSCSLKRPRPHTWNKLLVVVGKMNCEKWLSLPIHMLNKIFFPFNWDCKQYIRHHQISFFWRAISSLWINYYYYYNCLIIITLRPSDFQWNTNKLALCRNDSSRNNNTTLTCPGLLRAYSHEHGSPGWPGSSRVTSKSFVKYACHNI